MKPKKSDLLLILALLIAAGSIWFFFRPGEAGAYAVVTQNGREISRLSLSVDRSVTIPSDIGGFNTLTVENGTVFVSDADCGDHTCIHTGAVSHQGEQIVCLPHKLVIEVIGGDAPELDASTH